VWGDNLDVSDRVVDGTIRRLRPSLGEASSQIKTVFGKGYKLTEGK
jgi:DNA-binding response OmpR family regulator